MPSHQSLKDDTLLAELYSDLSSSTSNLLLEVALTKANIDRFVKKYLDNDIYHTAGPEGMGSATRRALEQIASNFIKRWDPRLQQRIKAAGGSADIFAYPSIDELDDMISRINSTSSRQQQRQEIKRSKPDEHMPVVYECDEYVMYRPVTWEASRKYFGAPVRTSLLDGEQKEGATWCTAASREAKGPLYFQNYTERGRLFYFIRKPNDILFATYWRNLPHIYNNMVRETAKVIKLAKKHGIRTHDESQDGFHIEFLMNQITPTELIHESRDQKNKMITLPNLYMLLKSWQSDDQQVLLNYFIDYVKFATYIITGNEYKVEG